jgi:SAM-dependent methyltransferase
MAFGELWGRLRTALFANLSSRSISTELMQTAVKSKDVETVSSNAAFLRFQKSIESMSIRRVVEFGTAQVIAGRSTHSFGLFPNLERSNYTMVDIKPGPDVDVVADIHSLPIEWTDRYDACIANAVFEHLERPWLAARQVANILAPGGACYISTHQTFPLHDHPKDFFRFSTDALALIFQDAGLEVLRVGYLHRTKIVLPPELLPEAELDAWNKQFPSYALVTLAAKKPSAG